MSRCQHNLPVPLVLQETRICKYLLHGMVSFKKILRIVYCHRRCCPIIDSNWSIRDESIVNPLTTYLLVWMLIPLLNLSSAWTTLLPSSTIGLRRNFHVNSKLFMGWLDFKPMHGSGSGKDSLDEQWEAQQALLRARRDDHLDKEHLKKKYQDKSVNHLDLMMKEHEVARIQRVQNEATSTTNESKPKEINKAFWKF